MNKFSTAVTINSSSKKIWTALTDPKLMSKWMGDSEMGIEVRTSWEVETPILIYGFHHVKFVNKGVVLKYDEEKQLTYTHLSSVSRLPDKKENYSILDFTLTPSENYTLLTLTIENFPTDTIHKHLEFYWRTTIITIKQNVESI
jgi:uncharacterized protein YndB with AHSA1/START domain